MKKTPKIVDLLKRVSACLDNGRFYDTSHAVQRKFQRRISLPEVCYVLKYGRHEKRKDEYKPEFGDWTYAIRGQTIDKKEIRIVIAFDEGDMLIITVIEIMQGSK